MFASDKDVPHDLSVCSGPKSLINRQTKVLLNMPSTSLPTIPDVSSDKFPFPFTALYQTFAFQKVKAPIE